MIPKSGYRFSAKITHQNKWNFCSISQDLPSSFQIPAPERNELPSFTLLTRSSTGRDGSMMRRGIGVALFVSLTAVVAPAHAAQSGIAAIYSYHSRTASGETSRPGALTAAHRTLPFGTMVRVTNKRNGRTVVVRINDRGPFTRGRVIDLTPAAATQLGFSGLTQVSLDVVGR
jgi:rare lipoprotein A